MRGERRAQAFAAVALALALAAGDALAAPAGGGAGKGGGMITLRASAEPLGSVGPSIHSAIEGGVDAAPVVLWSGMQPAAVLALSVTERSKPARVSYRLEDVTRSARPWPFRRGAFPLELEERAPRDKDGPEHVDELARILTADLDGDGTDEVVLVRRFGGLRVVGLDRARFERPSPPQPDVAHYMLLQTQRVRDGARDALYLLFERYASGMTGEGSRSAPGAEEPVQLLRVDAAGIRAVPLADAAPRPTGFAVFTKDGAVDAIAVFGWDREPGLPSTLHAPDGRRIGGPWRPKLASAPGGFGRLVTAPGRRLAAASLDADGGNVWLFDLESEPMRGGFVGMEESATVLHVATGGPQPIAVAAGVAWTWALGRDGKPWHRPKGTWEPCPPKRWIELEVSPPGPGYERPRIFPAEDASDQFLVVHTRTRQERRLDHAELLAAARQFLPETEVADLESARAADLDRELAQRLTWPMRHPQDLSAARYRNVEAFRAWLAENDLDARTVFTLVRGGRVAARFEVPGYHDTDERTEVRGSQVAWRAEGEAVIVVLSLKKGETSDAREERARFNVVRAGR